MKVRTANHPAILKTRIDFRALVLLFFLVAGAATVAAQTPKTKVNPKDGLTYVWVEPGTFQMGCSQGDSDCLPNEKPAHKVTISKGFWMGQTPVTQAAYEKFAKENPSTFKGAKLPVDGVSWSDAQSYCNGTDMRLPTEAEWEYAARGGSAALRYGPIGEIAWYDGNSGGKIHDVATKKPNAYGLYDMLGNVWEWTADYFGPYDGAAATDPPGFRNTTLNYKILHGGSYDSIESTVRVSYRNGDGPGYPVFYGGNGFRCVGN